MRLWWHKIEDSGKALVKRIKVRMKRLRKREREAAATVWYRFLFSKQYPIFACTLVMGIHSFFSLCCYLIWSWICSTEVSVVGLVNETDWTPSLSLIYNMTQITLVLCFARLVSSPYLRSHLITIVFCLPLINIYWSLFCSGSAKHDAVWVWGMKNQVRQSPQDNS